MGGGGTHDEGAGLGGRYVWLSSLPTSLPFLAAPRLLSFEQEPLLALRTPPWALRHAPLLRITLTVLRSLLISSRMEVGRAPYESRHGAC